MPNSRPRMRGEPADLPIRALAGALWTRSGIAILACLTLAAALLALAAFPSPAHGAESCRDANKHPRKLTPRQASDAVRCLIERRREAHGTRALSHRRELKKAAARHSRRMMKSGCFAHQCPGEADVAGRLHATSYLPCSCSWRVGETIAWGKRKRGSPRSIVKDWMRSSTHRQTLLTGAFEHIGIGMVRGRPGKAGKHAATYTVDLGAKN